VVRLKSHEQTHLFTATLPQRSWLQGCIIVVSRHTLPWRLWLQGCIIVVSCHTLPQRLWLQGCIIAVSCHCSGAQLQYEVATVTSWVCMVTSVIIIQSICTQRIGCKLMALHVAAAAVTTRYALAKWCLVSLNLRTIVMFKLSGSWWAGQLPKSGSMIAIVINEVNSITAAMAGNTKWCKLWLPCHDADMLTWLQHWCVRKKRKAQGWGTLGLPAAWCVCSHIHCHSWAIANMHCMMAAKRIPTCKAVD